MIRSLNTKVDLTIKGISYLKMGNYGKIMIGDNAFEFYNDINIRNYIQIPWNEVDYIMASVMFKGKFIPRFAIVTKKNGILSFSSRDNKKVLKTINKYIDSNKIVRSLSFFDVIRRGIRNIFTKNKK